MHSDATDMNHYVSWTTSGVAASIRFEGISSDEARSLLTSVRVLSETEWQTLAASVAPSVTTIGVTATMINNGDIAGTRP